MSQNYHSYSRNLSSQMVHLLRNQGRILQLHFKTKNKEKFSGKNLKKFQSKFFRFSNTKES